MKTLTLSIVIPVFNESDQIEACLLSIEAQTEAPDEVIVVDNNCTDSSIEIAKKFSFVTIVNEAKQGIVYARNKGFDSAKSDIIGRIDADTVLPDDWVSTIKRFYSFEGNANKAWTSGGFAYNFRLRWFSSWMQDIFTFKYNKLIIGHYILWGSSMAMPAETWQKVKPYVCLRTDIHEDIDLSIHLHQLGVKIAYKPRMQVGINLKRVKTRRSELWPTLLLWPRTFKVHHKKQWLLGVAGACLLYVLSFPIVLVPSGRKP